MSLRFDHFELDLARFEIARDGEPLPAEPKVLSVLGYLVEHRHRLVTKDELVEVIWEGRAVSDWTVTGCVKSARQLLGDTAKDKRFIKTVHGKGFRFVGAVKVEEGGSENQTPVSDEAIQPQVAHEAVVAILPFDNMSIDPEQEYLADGICEDIITILSKIPDLRVIARNSTFKYKNQSVDLRDIGRELGATHILEGSIRCIGNRVRVTAQLIEAIDGTHLWAEQYDREMSDVFALQDEITRQVVSALHIQLIAGERAKYWARGTKDFEAWKLQLRATQLVATQNKDDGKKGRELAEKAAELDPTYSEPWATLGISYLIELMDGWDEPPEVVLANSIRVLANALERNPENPLALVTFATIKAGMRDYEASYSMALRGYELGSDSYDIVCMYLLSAIYCGEIEDAKQAVIDLNRSYDTLEPWHVNALGFYHFACGNLRKSVNLAREALNRNPDYQMSHLQLAFVYAELGQMDEARHAARTLVRLNAKYNCTHARMTLAFKDPSVTEKIVSNLKRAGLP